MSSLLFVKYLLILFSSLYIDLTKLCYDFTCLHSGICTSNDNNGAQCECIETGYIGERCDKCKCSLPLKHIFERVFQ